jgi:hypothetical protein
MHVSVAVLTDTRKETQGISSEAASSPYAVEPLSDAELLAGTRGLVARSNQQLARLLAHLAEVEARGIHRARACASLCTYCVYELRLSEDTAFRYARAAKLVRQFPVLFNQIAAGEIHLTGLLLLGPHLKEQNHRDVLRLAKHRSKREITKLVRRLDPLPDVPARIDPLGPARPEPSHTHDTWSAFMQALNPVRELTPAECPGHWVHPGTRAEPEQDAALRASEGPTPARSEHDFVGDPPHSPQAGQDAEDANSRDFGNSKHRGSLERSSGGSPRREQGPNGQNGAEDVEQSPSGAGQEHESAAWLNAQR